MTWTDYQNEALRTAGQKQQWDFTLPSPSSPQQAQPARDSLAVAALGLAGEAGEAADLLKKVLFHNHPLDRTKLTKELGDVLWYLSLCAHVAGLSLEDVAKANILKLRSRYPEGFDPNRSLNR